MALRQLLITRELAALREEQNTLAAAAAGLVERRTTWEAREAAAEATFHEITAESTDEERAAFDAEAAEVETERAALEADETANQTRAAEVAAAIAAKEAELEEINKRAKAPKTKTGNETTGAKSTERKDYNNMDYREAVRAMARENEDVRAFLQDFREKRGITNATYTIPTVMLPMLRLAVDRYSKLKKYLSVTSIQGDANINLLGAIPEAVWTETTGRFNELSMGLSQISVAGHKVAGYMAIPNPYLQDSDENLAAIIVDSLGQSIAFAEDKAIVYGTGVNMPVGIVTRLTTATSPAWWGSKQGAYTNLATTNVGKLSAATVTGVKLFGELAGVLGKVKEVYRNGNPGKFWAMNSSTWQKLKMELMSTNAAGSLVTAMGETMPLLGGAVETLDFIPDGDIIGGFGSQYKYVNRAGMEIRQSEHVRFLDDQMVYAAVARGDGKPIAGEGFAAFNINAQNVTTSATFAEDTANATTSGDDAA